MGKAKLVLISVMVFISGGLALSAILLEPADSIAATSVLEATADQAKSLEIQGPLLAEFTIIAQEEFQAKDGSTTRRSQSTFSRRADGIFATVVIAAGEDGKANSPVITVGEPGRGLFHVDHIARKLIFIGPASIRQISPSTRGTTGWVCLAANPG